MFWSRKEMQQSEINRSPNVLRRKAPNRRPDLSVLSSPRLRTAVFSNMSPLSSRFSQRLLTFNQLVGVAAHLACSGYTGCVRNMCFGWIWMLFSTIFRIGYEETCENKSNNRKGIIQETASPNLSNNKTDENTDNGNAKKALQMPRREMQLGNNEATIAAVSAVCCTVCALEQ